MSNLQKIGRHYGWDYCEHKLIRRYCEDCKWDVPAFIRNGSPNKNSIIINAANRERHNKKLAEASFAK